MNEAQHPAQGEFDAVFQAFLNALTLLEKYEKRAVDYDALITVRKAEVHLRDAWLDLSGVKRHVVMQAERVRQLAAQHQSARNAYEQGWRDRLTDLIARFPGDEHADLRAALQNLSDD